VGRDNSPDISEPYYCAEAAHGAKVHRQAAREDRIKTGQHDVSSAARSSEIDCCGV